MDYSKKVLRHHFVMVTLSDLMMKHMQMHILSMQTPLKSLQLLIVERMK